MSRNLSTTARRSANASSTDEVWLSIVKLDNPAWAGSISLVNNTEAVVSNGETYQPFPFNITLPDEDDEGAAVVNWTAMNASLEIMDELRSATGPISGELSIILASNPDLIEIGPLGLQISGFEYDADEIQGNMIIDPIMDAQFGSENMDTTNAPGLF